MVPAVPLFLFQINYKKHLSRLKAREVKYQDVESHQFFSRDYLILLTNCVYDGKFVNVNVVSALFVTE